MSTAKPVKQQEQPPARTGSRSEHSAQEPGQTRAEAEGDWRRSGAGLARVTLIGNLGADPDVRYTADGRHLARLRVAVNRRRPGADGQGWDEHTDWYAVTAFGPLAERCAERLGKGARVFVDGRLQTHTKDGPEGPRTFLDVTASDVVPLDRRPADSPAPHDELDDLPF
jgi:single-strand DNA-binding protein